MLSRSIHVGETVMGAFTYQRPSDVTAVGGTVILDGPDGVAVSMTPEAAEETSVRLLEAARRAKMQLAEMR